MAVAHASIGGARVALSPPLAALRDAALVALVAMALAGPIVGLQTLDRGGQLTVDLRFTEVAIGIVLVFFGRLGLALGERGLPVPAYGIGAALIAAGFLLPWPAGLLQVLSVAAGVALVLRGVAGQVGAHRAAMARAPTDEDDARAERLRRLFTKGLGALLLVAALLLPLMPFANSYILDTAIRVLTYMMLAWGLNIVIGLAGLLDLGYVAFYAVGAYTYALLSKDHGFGFWGALPIAGLLAASFGVLLGFPVLRLRGDYLAIVTLGFGEIIRIVLLNWTSFSGGPNGIGSIPRLTFFGHPFVRNAPEGVVPFHQLMGIEFSPLHRSIFFFYLILVLALIVNVFTIRIRRLPVGRAWEALREDEIACRALGINPTNTKLTAFAIGAMFAGFAGSFFATTQSFVSPESFTFLESAMILAIVVLGGMGSQLGVALAAILVIGLTEAFRGLAEYRMLVFGLGMVLIMVWRPRGLLAHRDPTVLLHGRKGVTR
ncbi:high-affinity branched-chain amino acid ABC transporter permease LivM [Zavarzinia compransoris]|uniref:Branched-chain amino acid ABC transporter permease n=1 Tax=Zavarzinia compransoris TaxID=1264899 RepID=A0A317E1C6_9PROT|nr:high-affinity branched-chain amino acid ABC transporter permease LivM [Zavarzinia compransoris]PWR18945.1 branched-chain amino acid ABC transporter permease [Zavarzinia compransoris]TDP48945.1 amino acid/amide ABC transporter membrane protein 2 (HAAT family) [Zavarzinia compransoris]